MSGNNEADFERRLALAYRDPSRDADGRDFVASTLREVARRDRRRRWVLSAASLIGLSGAGATLAAFWPQGAFQDAGLIVAEVSMAGDLARATAGRLPEWTAVVAALAVIVAAGASTALRET